MSLYPRYYREFGLRLAEHLRNPPIHSITTFELPRNSVFHYLPQEGGTIGMPSDHVVARTTDRLVMVEHIESLTANATAGSPRTTNKLATTLTRDYHRRHRKLKRVRNLSTNLRDERTLLAVNYGLLPELYRYTQSVYSTFYQWSNIEKTLWATVSSLSETFDRQHFIPLTVPNPLPSLRELHRVETEVNRDMVGSFSDINRLLLLSVWRWLGEDRSTSSLSVLSNAQLNNVNLLLFHENYWLVVNLGKLNEWRDGVDESGGDVAPKQLQRRFLRLVMMLFERTSPVAPETTPSEGTPAQKKEKIEEGSPEEENANVRAILAEEADDDEEALEETVQTLNQRNQQRQRVNGVEVFTDQRDDPLKEGILSRANELAEEGVISAAEYRRFEKLSEVYQTLPDPRTGKGRLVEQSQITEDDIDLTESEFPDSATVTDKSMLKSTLQDFDRQYIRNVLPKDVSNMVLSMNRAGVAVTGYSVERSQDVANDFEIHTVKVTPVTGKPSTLKFRLPVVADDGTYVANGVRYRVRKQRGD